MGYKYLKAFYKSFLFASIFAVAGICEAELYKWTDDQGKVVYGDVVPPKYQSKAEKVVLKDLNTSEAVKPKPRTSNPRVQNQPRLNHQKQAERTRRSNNKYDEAQLTREYCRDNTNTVKARTDCFRAVENGHR